MKICGQDVELVFSDPEDWAVNAMGRSSTLTGRITLRKGLPKSVAHSTFLHELLHYIAMTNDIDDLDGKEFVISTIANSLLAWFRDNPELVMELTGVETENPFLQ